MKCSIFLATIFSPVLLQAQIIGNCNAPYNTPEGLVELLVGEGVEFSNVTFSGFECSAGFFDGTNDIGFESGLVMSTGGLASITPGGSGGALGGAGVDVDLARQLEIIGATVTNLNNLIVLEFDFVPLSDLVTFEYVFASNEYPSFTCSQYNDIFGFFLSGPGITGPFTNNATNIALVPDPDDPTSYTETPVIINTINSGSPSGFDSSLCDNIDPDWQDYSIFFTDNSSEETVSYPGFTVPLVATAHVKACETYHIKLAIADCADGILNSAVFLQENSFNSSPDIRYTVASSMSNIFNSTSDYVDYLYEGCGTATITFERPDVFDGDIVFDLDVSGTASNLLDYDLTNVIDNQIVMPAGELSVSMEILTNNDKVNEGVENIIIEIMPVDFGCYETGPDTLIFELHDQPELSLTVSDDVLLECPGELVSIEADAMGGVGGLMEPPYAVEPYIYEWFEVGLGSSCVVAPYESGNYCVQVTDVCGQQVSDCVFVDIEINEELVVSSDIVYTCEYDLEQICVHATSGKDDLSFAWSNGSDKECIEDYPGVYSVTVTDECGIQATTSGEIYLDEAPDPVFTKHQNPNENFMIEINNYTSEINGLSYSWDFGDDSGSILREPESHFYEERGEYYLTLGVTTEINNCYKETSQFVQVEPLYYFYAPNSFTPNGDLINDTFGPSIVGNDFYEMFIFDHWGNQIFYSNDVDNKWDGTFESRDVMTGTYVYKIIITKHFDDTIYEEFGGINLFR